MLIGIDIDGVLINTTDGVIKYFNEKYKKTITINDLVVYDWWDLWQVPSETIIHDFYEFLEAAKGKDPETVPGAVEAIEHMSKPHDLISITSREEKVSRLTDDIIKRKFNGKIRKVYYTGGFSLYPPNITKGKLAKILRVDLFIDNSMREVLECDRNNINSYLYDYPYNQGDLPASVTRVFSWKDIEDRLC